MCVFLECPEIEISSCPNPPKLHHAFLNTGLTHNGKSCIVCVDEQSSGWLRSPASVIKSISCLLYVDMIAGSEVLQQQSAVMSRLLRRPSVQAPSCMHGSLGRSVTSPLQRPSITPAILRHADAQNYFIPDTAHVQWNKLTAEI